VFPTVHQSANKIAVTRKMCLQKLLFVNTKFSSGFTSKLMYRDNFSDDVSWLQDGSTNFCELEICSGCLLSFLPLVLTAPKNAPLLCVSECVWGCFFGWLVFVRVIFYCIYPTVPSHPVSNSTEHLMFLSVICLSGFRQQFLKVIVIWASVSSIENCE